MPSYNRNVLLIGLLASIVALQMIASRGKKRSESISVIQMYDDEAWKEGDAADDEFLGQPTSALTSNNVASRHFSGALSLKDMADHIQPEFSNDGKHPIAETNNKGTNPSSPTWIKKLLLDHHLKDESRKPSASSEEPDETSKDLFEVLQFCQDYLRNLFNCWWVTAVEFL